MGLARKASTRRGEKDERELPSRPVTGGSITGDATLNGHHHTAERPMTMVVPAPVSADPGTHSASSSLLHLADHARRAARTPSPSPGRSRGREDHIVHGPDGDREDVEGVFERWSPLGVRFEIHIVKVRATTTLAQPCANAWLLGADSPSSWCPVPSRCWRWLAVPHARASCARGAQAVMVYCCLSHLNKSLPSIYGSLYSFVLLCTAINMSPTRPPRLLSRTVCASSLITRSPRAYGRASDARCPVPRPASPTLVNNVALRFISTWYLPPLLSAPVFIQSVSFALLLPWNPHLPLSTP